MDRLKRNIALLKANIEALRKTQDDEHRRLISDTDIVKGLEDLIEVDEACNPYIGARMTFNMALAYKEAAIKVFRPDIEIAGNRRKQQSEFAGKRHEEDRVKHEQWRAWQTEDLGNSRPSKTAQATRLKRKHGIPETVATIAKRLA